MARRADDLLSIFDPNRSQSDGGGRTRQKKSGKGGTTRRASSGSAGKKRGFQGLFLSQRQVILGGSAAALLLILTFTLGLLVGRPGSDDNPSLQRNAPVGRVMVRADFSRLNPHTQKPLTRHKVFTTLTKEFPVPTRAILSIREEGDRMIIELGPFSSDRAAQGYVQRWKLPAVHLNMDAPFRFHEIVDYKPKR